MRSQRTLHRERRSSGGAPGADVDDLQQAVGPIESGAPKQALGALLLFFTNFGAILLTGLIVMAI